MPQEDEIILSQDQLNTAIKSPEHLREWLAKSGRTWMVFNGVELVDALPFPHGHDALIQIIMAYRDHRMGIPSGGTITEREPSGTEIKVPRMKNEKLTIMELDRCIRSLITEASKLDPKWRLENAPL